MFGFGRKKNEKIQGIECHQEVEMAIKELTKAGYANAKNDREYLNVFYNTHELEVLDSELQPTIIMMCWLIKTYGDEEDKHSLQEMNGVLFGKPQNSLYFYWIPSQYIRCRQLGGEIRIRAEGRKVANSPEPTMQQNVLEEKYIQCRDIVKMFNEVSSMPEVMLRKFNAFVARIDSILSIRQQQTLIPETVNTIPLARTTQFNSGHVSSMKPTFEDGSYTFTNYLDGDIPVEDFAKIGQSRKRKSRKLEA